jgi:hypothetical protein
MPNANVLKLKTNEKLFYELLNTPHIRKASFEISQIDFKNSKKLWRFIAHSRRFQKKTNKPLLQTKKQERF